MRFRKLNRREIALLAVVGVGLLLLGIRYLRGTTHLRVLSAAPRSQGALPEVPRIGLDRLDARREPAQTGRRDIFAFGALHAFSEDERPDAELPPPPPVTLPPTTAALAFDSPPVPSVPPLALKYLGSVENARGIKVAILMTDKTEVLTGRAGETVANRYRIARIGLESVSLEDVVTGQSRQLDLKAN